MPWDGSRDQHEKLWQALDQVLNDQGMPCQRLAKAINQDTLAQEALRAWGDKRGDVIDDGTLARWHQGGVEAVISAREHKKRVIFEFFERRAHPQTLLYRPQEGFPPGLADFAALMGSRLTKPLEKDLSDLDGAYRIYRPAFTIPALKQQRVLISRLRISTAGGFTRFTEQQNYTDPDSSIIAVDETDDGAVLYFGGNIVLCGLSQHSRNCKFYAAWSCNPLPGDGVPVNRLRGVMIGITGAGPHASYPFVAYRSKEPFEDIETGIFRPSARRIAPDILGDLDIAPGGP